MTEDQGAAAPAGGLGDRTRPARPASVRRHNLALVLQEVAVGGGASRARLAQRTGLTKATVSALVDTLVEGGLVAEGRPERGAVGRPASPLALHPDGPVGLGVEVNVDYTSACVVGLDGQVRARSLHRADNRGKDPARVVTAAVAAGHRLLAGQARGSRLAGVGIAVPGPVQDGRVLRTAPNLPGWEDVDVAGLAAAQAPGVGVGVGVGNEANLAALAEHWYGGHAGLRDFVLVSGEIGVGSGIVLGGELFGGPNGYAGEIGHVLVDPAGERCGCGARGCAETVAGQEALLRAVGEPPGAATSTGDPEGPVAVLLRRCADGDDTARRAVARAGDALGVACAATVNLLDVPAIVLGGVYGRLAPWLVPALEAQLRERVVTRRWSTPRVLLSGVGPEAAVRGAAGSALRRVLDSPADHLG